MSTQRERIADLLAETEAELARADQDISLDLALGHAMTAIDNLLKVVMLQEQQIDELMKGSWVWRKGGEG